MNAGVNFLREHVKETVRIHYAIMDGGKAPNIVPDYARVWYFVRDYNRKTVEDVYARVLKCAEGAALMTGTTHEIRFIGGIYNYLPNKAVSEVVQKNMEMVGVPKYTPEETAYAKAMQKTLGAEEKGMATTIEPLKESTVISGGSTDASDVSWIVPTTRNSVSPSPRIAGHRDDMTSASIECRIQGHADGLKVLSLRERSRPPARSVRSKTGTIRGRRRIKNTGAPFRRSGPPVPVGKRYCRDANRIDHCSGS